MQVVLTVESGPAAGRKIVLVNSQTAQVGRSAAADLVIPTDPNLSRFHFELRNVDSACRLRSLSHRNSTRVNGQVRRDCMLANGDRVFAGSSRFHIEISQSLQPSMPRPHKQGRLLKYRATRCPSGVYCFEGKNAVDFWKMVGQSLQRRFNSHIVIDLRRARLTAPKTVVDSRNVFRKLSAAPFELSPTVMLGKEDNVVIGDMLSRHWGRGAISVVFTRSNAETAFDSICDRATSFFDTKILLRQLKDCPPPYVETLLQNLSFVLIDDASGGWQLVTAAEQCPSWQEIGFANPPASTNDRRRPF